MSASLDQVHRKLQTAIQTLVQLQHEVAALIAEQAAQNQMVPSVSDIIIRHGKPVARMSDCTGEATNAFLATIRLRVQMPLAGRYVAGYRVIYALGTPEQILQLRDVLLVYDREYNGPSHLTKVGYTLEVLED